MVTRPRSGTRCQSAGAIGNKGGRAGRLIQAAWRCRLSLQAPAGLAEIGLSFAEQGRSEDLPGRGGEAETIWNSAS